MFDGLFKPRFYTKCKSLIKLTKTRLETVRRRKNAVCKYLKNDIADLLKNGLDYNAYGRTEGLLDETKRIFCYDFIERFYVCVGSNVSLMQKSRECPEECRVAVSSLVYAAARIPEIPELCHLRSLFTERYGDSLEAFVNQEFFEIFKVHPPSKETKLQLMQEIAQELSIKWDSKDLEQKLYTPPPPIEPERMKNDVYENKSDQEIDKVGIVAKENKNGRKASVNDKSKFVYSSSEDESIKTRDSSERDSLQASSSSFGSISEDEPETKKPFYHRFIQTPHARPKSEKEESNSEENAKPKPGPDNIGKEEKSFGLEVGSPIGAKPKPRSVRRRFAKLPPVNPEVSDANSSETMQEKMTKDFKFSLTGDKTDKDSVYPLKPPPSRQALSGRHLKCDSTGQWELKNNVMSGSCSRRHIRSGSWQPEPLTAQAADRSKPPDFDELAARVAELRRR